jgi:hypothetical protein
MAMEDLSAMRGEIVRLHTLSTQNTDEAVLAEIAREIGEVEARIRALEAGDAVQPIPPPDRP